MTLSSTCLSHHFTSVTEITKNCPAQNFKANIPGRPIFSDIRGYPFYYLTEITKPYIDIKLMKRTERRK